MKTCKRGHAMTGDNVVHRVYRNWRADRCRACERLNSKARAERKRHNRTNAAQGAKPEGYVPLDDLLSMPFNRVLKGLRYLDWVETRDLLEAIDAPIIECTERNTLTCAISRLVRTGDIERRSLRSYFGKTFEVRLTEQGRARLESVYAEYRRRLDEVDLSDEELQERAA